MVIWVQPATLQTDRTSCVGVACQQCDCNGPAQLSIIGPTSSAHPKACLKQPRRQVASTYSQGHDYPTPPSNSNPPQATAEHYSTAPPLYATSPKLVDTPSHLSTLANNNHSDTKRKAHWAGSNACIVLLFTICFVLSLSFSLCAACG